MELTIDEALQRGIAAHREGKFQEADKFYTAILKAQPEHSDANHNMGVLAVSLNKVEASLPFFKTALDANPKVEQYWLSYIDALIKFGRLDEARSLLEQGKANGLQADKTQQFEEQLNVTLPSVSNASPSQEQIDSLVSLYTNGDFDEALDQALVLSKQFPSSAIIFNILGAIYSGLERYEEATLSYQEAIKLNPTDATFYNNIGKAFIELSKYTEAIVNYDKAIELQPKMAEIHYNKGIALYKIGKNETAISTFKKAIQLSPTHVNAHYNLGNTLKESKKYEAAIRSYKKVIELKSDHVAAYNNLAIVKQNTGKLEEALLTWEKALTLKPDFALGYNNLARALRDSSKYENGIQNFDRAFYLQPSKPEYYAQHGYNLSHFPYSLKKTSSFYSAIQQQDWQLSIKILTDLCNVNILHSGFYRKKFLELWSENIFRLIEESDVKGASYFFTSLYAISGHDQKFQAVEATFFDTFELDVILDKTKVERKMFILSSYYEYQMRKSGSLRSAQEIEPIITSVAKLLNKTDSINTGWLLIKNMLSCLDDQQSARIILSKLAENLDNTQ